MPSATKNTIEHPLLKFSIGLTAGLVAIAIPRLSSDLSTLDSFSTDFYSFWFIITMIVFALLIGLVITIMEYKVPRTPKDTFFSALAIPALVAGSLNTAIETHNANDLEIQTRLLSEQARSINQIEIESVPSMDIIHFEPLNDQASIDSSFIQVSFFPKAYADKNNQTIQSSPIQKRSQSSYIQRQPVNFAVSLYQFDNKDSAIKQARKLKSKNIPATVIRLNKKRYDVLSDSNLITESEATLKALEFKKQFAITPKILKLK